MILSGCAIHVRDADGRLVASLLTRLAHFKDTAETTELCGVMIVGIWNCYLVLINICIYICNCNSIRVMRDYDRLHELQLEC